MNRRTFVTGVTTSIGLLMLDQYPAFAQDTLSPASDMKSVKDQYDGLDGLQRVVERSFVSTQYSLESMAGGQIFVVFVAGLAFKNTKTAIDAVSIVYERVDKSLMSTFMSDRNYEVKDAIEVSMPPLGNDSIAFERAITSTDSSFPLSLDIASVTVRKTKTIQFFML